MSALLTLSLLSIFLSVPIPVRLNIERPNRKGGEVLLPLAYPSPVTSVSKWRIPVASHESLGSHSSVIPQSVHQMFHSPIGQCLIQLRLGQYRGSHAAGFLGWTQP